MVKNYGHDEIQNESTRVL